MLNILWLMLALPAIWVWRQKPECAHESAVFSRFRPFLLLGCVLVLLFPVVSATDDLHAMRPEMEECNPCKRVLKQLSGSKSVDRLRTPNDVPAQLGAQLLCGPDHKLCGQVSLQPLPSAEQVQLTPHASRAPPAFHSAFARAA